MLPRRAAATIALSSSRRPGGSSWWVAAATTAWTSVSPTAGQFANIESITAVVIGGISLFGGRGSILGMLFGALIVGVFSLGLRLWGTDPQWTYSRVVPPTGQAVLKAVNIDDWFFGLSAIGADGHESPVVFPGAAGTFERGGVKPAS